MNRYKNILILLFFLMVNMIVLRIIYTKINQKIGSDEKPNQEKLISAFIANKGKITEYKSKKINFNEDKKQFFPNISPIETNFEISQKYSDDHQGIDLVAKKNTVIKTTAAGFVEKIVVDKYLGNVAIVNHLNGLSTMYAHLSKFLVQENIFVMKNETIGVIGNTGYSSATHLHYAILKNNKYVNPEKYWEKL
ncbi:MAG: M23 family metallopeptidase [Candidatus Cloacimonadota bacterium]|nr:M23 family metallopeptidase [Candidatus Cloacimonadota bacterium]